MLIKTSKGNEYDGVLADAPTYDGGLMVQIRDERPLSEIAAEFEGLDWVLATDLMTQTYRGYKVLKLIVRDDVVQLKMYKE